jgi:hypothetical protein
MKTTRSKMCSAANKRVSTSSPTPASRAIGRLDRGGDGAQHLVRERRETPPYDLGHDLDAALDHARARRLVEQHVANAKRATFG